MFWSKCVFVSALAGWFAWHFRLFEALKPEDLRTLLGIAAQVAVTMLGFVMAALAILSTVAGTRLVRNMQKTGHYEHLLQRMLGSVVAFALLAAGSFATLFFATLPELTIYVLLALSLFAGITLADVLRKFWIVMRTLAATQQY